MKKFLHSPFTRLMIPLLCLASRAGSLIAAPGDAHWDRQFGLPGTTNRVFALRFNGNNLYASGNAIGPGGLAATNTGVDIFDGTNWSSTIGEITAGTMNIYDVGFLKNDVYVGGIFTKAGGVSAPGLAKWNGSDWSNVATTNFAGFVLAFATDGTNLYVGGAFTNIGGVLSTNIARYDGTNWYGMGSLGYYNSSIGHFVYVLEWHNGLLYAGGIFTNAGPAVATNIAVWNGSSWASLGSGAANGVNGEVMALTFNGDDLYVGGSCTNTGASAFGIAKWSGGTWSAIGGGCRGGPVTGIGFLGSDLYVCGGFTNVAGVAARTFAKWDGFNWTTWPLTDGVFQYPFNDTPNRMRFKDGSLYIGGNFSQAGDVIANHIVRFDGANYYALGAKPANGIATPQINVSCIGQANDGIYVGGLLTAAGKTLASRIARWDGNTWNDVGGGTAGGNSSANRVLAIAGQGSDVYVGGTFTNVGGTDVGNIAHWNGANWFNMGFGFDGSVGALAVSGSAVYVGGSFTNVTDFFTFQVNHIAMWDGFQWNALSSGVNQNGNVNAIAVSGNNVYAAGTFTNASGTPANRVALWDGISWSSLGTGTGNGLSGTVFAITTQGSDVYVGGSFTNAGTTVVRGIAKWNGTTWSGLGTGVTLGSGAADVRDLAFGGDGKLYCCGRFTNISGVNANGIARWDGANWQALGSGMFAASAIDRPVGLTIQGNDVWVVGQFDGAGLCDSSGIARWNETIDFTPPFTMSFSRTQTQPTNTFKSRLTCSELVTYAIEYSDDFQTWTSLLTNSAKQLDFTNAVSPAVKRRAFRARNIP